MSATSRSVPVSLFVAAVTLSLFSAACNEPDPPGSQNVTIQSQLVPSGFVDELVASGISSPTAMTFAPDGRLFVAQQNGQLRVISNGSPRVLLATPFLTVNVDSAGERGLLGVAF